MHETMSRRDPKRPSVRDKPIDVESCGYRFWPEASVESRAMIKNILFDLDGTLTDPKDGITRCIQHALVQLGSTPPEADELIWCIGPPLQESFAILLDTDEKVAIDQALDTYRYEFSRAGLVENRLYPYIDQSLQVLQNQGYRLFLATSKPRVYAVRILDHFGLTGYFDGVYGSELNGRLTDKGELIAHVLQTEGLNPATCLMVGDRKHDIMGGKQNGVKTAAVTNGYGSRDEIARCSPDLIVNSLSELTRYLDAQNAK